MTTHLLRTSALAALLVALATAGPSGQPTLRAGLIGHWTLKSVDRLREGEPPVAARGESPVGMITYTADGHMQAELGPRSRPKVQPSAATPAQTREILRTFTAYFGTFTVDEKAGTVTHHRDGSSVPGDRDFLRSINLSSDRNTLELSTPPTVVDGKKQFARITWERLPVATVVPPHAAAARKAVAGTWELVEHKTTMPDGEVRHNFGPSPKGLFIFHEDGHTTVQLVNLDRPSTRLPEATDDEVRALTRTYLAYFGSFDVDPAKKQITVHTTAGLSPMNAGAEQIRFYEIDGDTLRLQPPPAKMDGGQRVSQITWRRVK